MPGSVDVQPQVLTVLASAEQEVLASVCIYTYYLDHSKFRRCSLRAPRETLSELFRPRLCLRRYQESVIHPARQEWSDNDFHRKNV